MNIKSRQVLQNRLVFIFYERISYNSCRDRRWAGGPSAVKDMDVRERPLSQMSISQKREMAGKSTE